MRSRCATGHKAAVRFALLGFGVLLALAPSSRLMAADQQFVAGVKPFERPANAPVITKTQHAPGWREQVLTGVSKPVPQHILNFLDDQGHWFNPFTRSGMTGKYDIRGWHDECE